MELIGKIMRDILEPLAYLPYGMAGGFLFLLFLRFVPRSILSEKEKCMDTKKISALFFLTVYLIVLLILTFFSREPGSRNRVDLELFGTWNSSLNARAFFLENILLFIPMGFLLPFALRTMRRGSFCILTGCLCSIALELTQLLTQRGFCQLDDVVTNTAGTVLGWLLFRALSVFFCRRRG